jgi:hypothetical protein
VAPQNTTIPTERRYRIGKKETFEISHVLREKECDLKIFHKVLEV